MCYVVNIFNIAYCLIFKTEYRVRVTGAPWCILLCLHIVSNCVNLQWSLSTAEQQLVLIYFLDQLVHILRNQEEGFQIITQV